MLHFRCPSCNRPLTASENKAGRSLPCPACNSSIQVPLTPVSSDEELIDLESLEPDELPPPVRRRKSKSATSDQTGANDVETEPCLHCGATTVFPSRVAGHVGECFNCGQPVPIPTVKQYQYRLREQRTSRRTLRWMAIAIVTPCVLIFAIYKAVDYRHSQTPSGAAEKAWYAQNRGGLGPFLTVRNSSIEVSHGDITIIRIEYGIAQTASNQRYLRKKGLGNLLDLPDAQDYVVLQNLKSIEIVSASETTLDKLTHKYMATVSEATK